MAVLLYTDMVDSSGLQTRLGTEAYSRLLERHDQQEGEQELDAGKAHADLVEQLDELAVDPLLPALGSAVVALRAGHLRPILGGRSVLAHVDMSGSRHVHVSPQVP
jgi:hypothetical protein